MTQPFVPAKRTIMTPGPVEAEPRVLRAMSTPILGQFDPLFTSMMNDVMADLRRVFQTSNHWAFPIDGTSRSGLEAVLCSIIHPGDKVLVPVFGRFGQLLTEIAERYGAEVFTMECEWGTVFEPAEVIDEIERIQPHIVAAVHGETSTGCLQPLQEIGRCCREMGSLFVVDAVASLGGTDVKVDEWYVDAAIAGTQKCLSVPSGMAPITYNERVEQVVNARKKVEQGIATAEDELEKRKQPPIASNYFDLSQLQDYWSPRRLNHHTEATTMLYGLQEGLRIVLEEGLEERFRRHRFHEQALKVGLQAMGLSLYADHDAKLPMVTCVTIPDNVDADAIRHLMLEQFGVEIAASFGPLKGKIWRIGTMGYSCRRENVLFTLSALEAALLSHHVPIYAGHAVQKALEVYQRNTEGVQES
ncbi:pyridoxal-phosphate-dependent aminotransferase family protein [Salibacterium lacus]|uniref:Pyridoxal-phosphate-dependent aminotransferase family protein n=1 Tax=Salibacterium lacus TaxID=1898109 RepID=A0ABW5T433_9BACI